MIITILSVILVELILLVTFINKYRKAQKRYLSWKSDYIALKYVLDKHLNNADKLPFDDDWQDSSTWTKVKI